MIPKRLQEAADRLKVTVGRLYDSTGKHVSFYYQHSPDWKVYRHSVSGMLALLRYVAKDKDHANAP